MDIIKRANKPKVEPELMGEAMEAFAALPPDKRDFDGGLIEVVKLVSELDLPDQERGDLGIAISFRLTALARLMRDGGGRGWTLPGESGFTFIHEELVRCAAEEPMIKEHEQPAFDPESFNDRLLALAEMRGSA